MEEDEERKINDIQMKYEKKLYTEKETNANLKGKTGIMTQKVTRAKIILRFSVKKQQHFFAEIYSHLFSHVISSLLFVFLLDAHWCDHSSTLYRDRLMTGVQT